MVGTTISHYKVLEKIGQGGMGEVYLAQDTTLDRKVALKFLPEELRQDSTARKRFLREAKSAAALDHPFICHIHEIGEANGKDFISMEYIRGTTLQEKLGEGPLPLRNVLETAGEIAEALEAAHEQGIVHRDLKPSNIMLTPKGHVKVMDFGLAKRVVPVEGQEEEITTVLTRADSILGTVPYMSPEQIRGQTVDTRSDIFSFGVVLYEMLAGVHPFKKGGQIETASAILSEEPSPLSDYVLELPEALQHTVQKLLVKRVEGRCQSATEVLIDLEQIAASIPFTQGGDRRAAPVARGKTPAPALVANAGKFEGLSPAVAWTCLVWILMSLAGTFWMAGQSHLSQIVPLPKSPELLVADARAILQDLGYPTPQRDSTNGFSSDSSYIDYLMSRDRSNTWWELLARGEPSVIRFWYRESPQYLVPHRVTEFFPTEYDPPLSVPGMVSLQLDTRGRLRQLEAVPADVDDSGDDTLEGDWGSLFAAAKLNLEDFTPDEPQLSPSSRAYQQVAWQGTYPDAPEIPIRIEAAFFRGRTVAFRILEPWNEPAGQGGVNSGWVRSEEVVPDARARFALVGFQLLFMLTLALLARHNLRAGRGDRKLAFRLACFFFAAVVLQWIFGTHHVPELSQVEVFFGVLYRAFFAFGLAWLFYIALEPYAQGLWPQTLISWVRLLEGRVRDPRVGRDVLLGCAYGIGGALAVHAFRLAPLWLGSVPGRPDFPRHPAELIALRGVKESLAELFAIQLNISIHILYLIVGLLLLRFVFRRTWLAVGIHAALYVFVYGSGFGFLGMVLWIGLWYLVFFRCGWLSILVGTLTMDLLGGYPLTTDLWAWYAHASILVALFCLGLTLYGFKVSLGGRPVLKDLLAEG